MVFVFSPFELDEELFELRRDGAKVPVQPKVLSLLFLLVRERARVVPKQELFEKVWADVTVGDASLARAAMEARKAIGDDAQQVITTVRGRGFRFAAAVEERASGQARDSGVPQRSSAPPLAPLAGGSASGFVGREACMAALEARLTGAVEGRPTVVWLTGEAGVGKTRVTEELARLAAARGVRVFFGRATDADGAPPFWPWGQVVRAFAGERTDGAELLRIAVSRMPHLAPAGSAVAPLSSQERFQRFDAFTRWLESTSQASPLVIVLDDLHLADIGSLALLQFFAREAKGARVLVVGTYRDTAPLDPERAKTLGALVREHTSFPIALRGLAQDEVARFVEAHSGREPSPALLAALIEKSSGIPRYLQQMLETEWAERALRDSAREILSSMELQQGLLDSIAGHLDAVSSGCREVLITASLFGRAFEFAPLAAATRFPPAELLALLDEAERQRVLIRGKSGHKFAHALVRDVLYKRLPLADRALRHRAVGEVLLAHYGDAADAHAEELAIHFYRAAQTGEASRGAHFSVRAAEQAALRGDLAESATHYEHAVQALALLPGEEGRRAEMHLALARARERMGDAAAARAAFVDAALLARALRRAVPFADAAIGHAMLCPRDGRSMELLETAQGAIGQGLTSGEWIAAGDTARLAELTQRIESLARDGTGQEA